MQQPITRRDVYEPALTATIGGRDIELESASMDRMLPDPLVGGSLTAASGDLVAVEGPDVTETVATPWDPGAQWPPVPETGASVSMDTGAGPVSILTNGRVVSASGGTSGREVDVEVADAYQTLDRPISWGPLGRSMPALTEATTQRYVSLRATAVTDRILRHCGWYATPPALPYAALSVPAMGTMWPERGTCLTSGRMGTSGYPVMFTEPWGVGVSDVDASYRLGGGGYGIKERGRMELTAVAGRQTGSTMSLSVSATGSIVRLSWNDNTAYAWITDPSGVTSAVVSRSRSVGSFLYATVEYVSDSSVYVTLRVDGGESGVLVPCRTQVTLNTYTEAQISGQACGGGFQVAFPSTTGGLVDWTPNAVIYDRGAAFNHLIVLPSVEGENCADLLAAQCEAQNATYWIDETGVLQWVDMARLESRSNVATLNSDDDIAESGFTWDHSLSSVKRSVSVNWREPLTHGGWRTDVDLWQGSGQTLGPTGTDNPVEDWINVPNDEVWIMPDLGLARVGDDPSGWPVDFNYGWGSWYGGVVRTSDDADQWAQFTGSFLMSIERVTDKAFKYQMTWTGSSQAIQRTPQGTESAGMWGMRRGMDLPIIRGKKKYTLGDQSYTASQVGPATAPDHVIDAGWWIQTETQARHTADYVAARLTVPQPVLSSIALIPTPGLQLGDMVTVTDTHVSRLTVRGVVTQDSRSINADMDMRHAVAIRPIAVSRNGVTWAEWAQIARPKTWAQWSTNQNSTWQQWGSDPLGKE